MPKGLSAETVEPIISELAAVEDASASEIGEAVGISRVSVRASRDPDYPTKGRPGTRYRAIDGPLGR